LLYSFTLGNKVEPAVEDLTFQGEGLVFDNVLLDKDELLLFLGEGLEIIKAFLNSRSNNFQKLQSNDLVFDCPLEKAKHSLFQGFFESLIC